MEANELRIGNWVVYGHTTKHYRKIGWEDIRDCFVTTDLYNPISLTPTILEIAGFEKKDDYNGDPYWLILSNPEYPYIALNISFCRDNIYFERGYHNEVGADSLFLPMPASLHHLQNLFFALTGQELQIDLTDLYQPTE